MRNRSGRCSGRSQDNFAYVPVETYIKIYGAYEGLWINVQARGPEWMERTQDEARVLMRARRHLAPNDTDSFGILDSATLMNLWKQLTGVIAMAMVGVVSVFLVIGGVVIMNVMLATVTERTREIGIRKALGASRNDIMMQFLVEACVMSAVGGALGVIAAYGVCSADAGDDFRTDECAGHGGCAGRTDIGGRGHFLWRVSGTKSGNAGAD